MNLVRGYLLVGQPGEAGAVLRAGSPGDEIAALVLAAPAIAPHPHAVLAACEPGDNRMLIFGQRHLQLVLAQYEAHYNGCRPTAAGIPTRPAPTTLSRTSPRSRSSAVPSPGGLINEYERAA